MLIKHSFRFMTVLFGAHGIPESVPRAVNAAFRAGSNATYLLALRPEPSAAGWERHMAFPCMLLRQARDWETSIAQRLMAKKKRKHSKAEIAAKLAQANDLATQGKLQSHIARTLGVSVMTLYRWRKMPSDQTTHTRIAELQLENSRLRRLVADLLLEKMKLEEG
jgi:putative transposase